MYVKENVRKQVFEQKLTTWSYFLENIFLAGSVDKSR